MSFSSTRQLGPQGVAAHPRHCPLGQPEVPPVGDHRRRGCDRASPHCVSAIPAVRPCLSSVSSATDTRMVSQRSIPLMHAFLKGSRLISEAKIADETLDLLLWSRGEAPRKRDQATQPFPRRARYHDQGESVRAHLDPRSSLNVVPASRSDCLWSIWTAPTLQRSTRSRSGMVLSIGVGSVGRCVGFFVFELPVRR